ncbi:MAG: hypothetical protein SGJ19_25440 [Planctomycetia bacterium]|nr:hypothetical protein [Planctomycetia bacterium]
MTTKQVPLPQAPAHLYIGMPDQRSQLDLDDDQGFFSRLGQFFSALFLGPLIGLLFWLGIEQNRRAAPLVATIAENLLKTLVLFWVLLLVFIWYRPSWLRRLYLRSERKVVFVGWITRIALFLAIVFAAGWGLVDHFLLR